MSSSRRALLLAALCTPFLALPLRAAKPNDNGPRYSDDYTQSPAEIGGKSYDQWKTELSNPDPSVRAHAIMVMPYFRQRGEEAIPRLAHIAQHDGDASPRVKAVLALQVMRTRDKDRDLVIRALGYCVAHDPQTIIRYEAARALPKFGTDSQRVIPDLVTGMGNSSTWEVREVCIQALRAAGVDPKKGPDPRVTDALIARLNSYTEPTKKVRLEAIIALGGMGRPQDPGKYTQVMTALKGPYTYKSRDKVVKLWSHVAIMALDDKVDDSYLKTVVDYMRDRERDVRVHAVSAMGVLGVKAHEYVRDVIARLDDKETEVVLATCQALGRMGDRGPRVLSALIKATEREGTAKDALPIVMDASKALVQIGVTSPEVMAALNKVAERKDLDEQQKFLIARLIEEIKKPKEDVKRAEKAKEKPKGEIINKNNKRGGGR
jgi:HEAT repeat protein